MRNLRVPPRVIPVLWIAFALVVKGAFFTWYLTQTYYHDVAGFRGQSNGDMLTYIIPVEKLLATGDFATDDRMPGYPALYYLLRRLFSQSRACNVLIVIQLLVAAVSVYGLGVCARRLFRSQRAFYWAYFIYLFSTFVSVFDAYFLTESLATSASIFFLWTWLWFEEDPRRWLALLVSGVCLGWSTFLKPAHLPMLALLPTIWGLRWLQHRLSGQRLIRYSLLFLLPFLLADALWTARNYRRYHELIPLLKSPWYAESFWPANYFDLMAFCKTYGEDYSYWFPNTGIRWMMGWGNNVFLPPGRWHVKEQLGPPPDYVYTSRFNRDSLTHLRNLYYEAANDMSLSSIRRQAYHAEIHQKLGQYTQSVRDEKPEVYYGLALLRYTYTFLNGSWGYSFLDDIVPQRWPRQLLRMYHYLLVLLPGLIGLVWLVRRGLRTDDRLLVVPMALLTCWAVYVLALRHPETRYLAPFYPFLILSATGLFLRLNQTKPRPVSRLSGEVKRQRSLSTVKRPKFAR